MSSLISRATGNFTASTTFALCNPTAELDSEAGTTVSTTSPVYSSTFTPGAITVDGIALKLSSRTSGGTLTVELFNNTAGSSVATVTVNIADLSTNGTGWHFFKFGSSQLLIAANAYKIGVSTSTAGTVTIFRDATAANWSRELRTTTTQAPAAGDKIICAGELSGAGTGSSFVITMDNTATTIFGSTSFPQSISVNLHAQLGYGVAASTAYYLKYNGIFKVFSDGIFNIGTSGSRIPASSSAVLEMNSAANVDTGLVIDNNATFNVYGDNTRTTVATLMTADKAAAATVITLASTAGWSAGDVLAFAPTSRTPTDAEIKTILTVDSSTQVTLTSGLTNAHSGTSPTQAEVINLTRNIKIRGISSPLQGYIQIIGSAVANIDYAEFTRLGSGTSNKRGIDIQVSTGSCSMTHCSNHDSTVSNSIGFNVTGAASNNVTLQYNVSYNIANAHYQVLATTGTNWLIDSNVAITNADSTSMYLIGDIGGTFTNCTATGSQATTGMQIGETSGTITGTYTNLTSHSNFSTGIAMTSITLGGTLGIFTIWRNGGNGFQINNFISNVYFSGMTLFGNAIGGIAFAAGSSSLTFDSITASGDTSFSTPVGVTVATGTMVAKILFTNSTFGVASGIFNAHTAGDFTFNSRCYADIVLNNCNLASTVPVANQSNLVIGSNIGSEKNGQVAGNQKSWTLNGTISIDTVIYNTASPSQRLTPSSASLKLQSGPFQIAVANGQTLTPTVYTRESVVGDGTAYNGNQPRLIVQKNVAMGIASDTVLATASVAVGSWGSISGTTAAVTDDGVLSFIVDCDGTAGWVNVDDVTVV